MYHEEGLPQTGEAQDIGHDAVTCLWANKPRSWLPRELDGGDDYGLDFQIQLKVDQKIVDVFRVQLKGTRTPKLNADGTFFSIALSATTLRYYDNIVEPILLVLCDLSVDPENPAKCPLYYVWVRLELRRIEIEKISLSQEEVTLRVPTANLITTVTDLLQDVRQANELAKVGHALDVRVADIKPEMGVEQRLEVVRGVERGITARSADFVEALAETPRDHWVKPARGTIAWNLREAGKQLKAGKIEKCRANLEEANAKLTGATSMELEEFWHLSGRHKTASDDNDGASSDFRKAADVQGGAKYWASWAECELRRCYEPNWGHDFSDVISALPGGEPQILSVKARLLAANRKYDEALALLKTFSGSASLSALAVVQTMYSKPREALQ